MRSDATRHRGILSTIPDGYYTVTMAAEELGRRGHPRSVDTLRRWHREGLCVPSHEAKYGRLTVHLYSEKDVLKLVELAVNTQPGRPCKTA